MKYIIGLLFLIILFSCNKNEKVFHSADTESGNFELYFVPQIDIIESLDISSENNIYPSFKIENSEIVKEIINTWTFQIVENVESVSPMYYVEIAKDNETYVGRWINDSLNLIFGSNYHKFGKDYLDKYQEHFKPIVAYNLKIVELSSARSFVKILQDNNGYLFFHRQDIPYYWEEYSGTIELEYPNKDLPSFESSKEINTFLQNEFNGISKVEENSFNIQFTEETALFEILCEYDISEKLPDNFTIKSEWKELSNLEILVFNLSENDIIQIAQEHGIDTAEIIVTKY